MFTLVPVESNLTEAERDRFIDRLRVDLAEEGLSLRKVELTYQQWDPVEALEKALGPGSPEPLVLLVCGLERTPPGPVTREGVSRPPAFARLNQTRELLEERYPVPTIVWCEPFTYGTLRRHAPDFFDHFTGLVRLQTPRVVERDIQRELQGLAPATARWESTDELSSAAAVRFYEERLEIQSLNEGERIRALLGLSEALVVRRKIEGIAALERAADYAEQARAMLTPEMDLETWSRANFLRARALDELGRPGSSLGSAEQAVDGYRRLSLEKPEEFRERLASALNTLSLILGNLDRHAEALTAIQQAVDIRRDLAHARLDASQHVLAKSLNNLAVHLGHLGWREKALQAIQQAVEIWRDLSHKRPEAFRPALALSLNNLSLYLADLERRQEALEASQQAVEVYRDLAQARPDAFRPELALSLGALHLHLREIGQEQAALEAITEALGLLEPHFRRLPRAFASLIEFVARGYEDTAKACGVQPEEARLRSLQELLASIQKGD